VTFMAKDKDGNAKKFSYVKKGSSKTPRAKTDFMMGRKTDRSFETNFIFNSFHYGSEKLKTGGTVTDDGFTMDVEKYNTSPSRGVLESDQSGMLGNSSHPMQAINVIPGSPRMVKQIIPSSQGNGTGDPLETTRDFGQSPSIMIEDFTQNSTAHTPFGQPMPIGSFRKLFLDPNSKLGCTRNSGFANDVSHEKSSWGLQDSPPKISSCALPLSPFQKSSRLLLDTPGLENSRYSFRTSATNDLSKMRTNPISSSHRHISTLRRKKDFKKKVKDQETQKFLDIFNNLPRGKFFVDKKNLYMETKSSLAKGQDFYQEFFKRIPESERKFIKNFQKQKIFNGINQLALCAEDGKFGQAVPKKMRVFAGIKEAGIPLGLEFLK
jgi:hypothetical protein